MTQVIETALNTLKARGFRLTVPRRAVISTLAGAERPQTIQDIVAVLDVDEATVYRTIRTLEEEALVEAIPMPTGGDRYSLSHEHHHHLICTRCERVEHLPCTTLVKAPTSKNFAAVTGHEITFHGICKKCAR